MANIAIKIMVGSSPLNYVVGHEYFFKIGEENSKIDYSEVERKIREVMEDHLYEEYGEPEDLKQTLSVHLPQNVKESVKKEYERSAKEDESLPFL